MMAPFTRLYPPVYTLYMSESIKAKNHLRSVMPDIEVRRVHPLAPRIPKKLSSSQALEVIQSTFEVIGGRERFAIWADENYDEFVKIWGKTLARPGPTPTGPQTAIQINVGNLRTDPDGG